jgi:hypothetical protein
MPIPVVIASKLEMEQVLEIGMEKEIPIIMCKEQPIPSTRLLKRVLLVFLEDNDEWIKFLEEGLYYGDIVVQNCPHDRNIVFLSLIRAKSTTFIDGTFT